MHNQIRFQPEAFQAAVTATAGRLTAASSTAATAAADVPTLCGVDDASALIAAKIAALGPDCAASATALHTAADHLSATATNTTSAITTEDEDGAARIQNNQGVTA